MIVQTPYEMLRASAKTLPRHSAIVFVSASGAKKAYSYQELLDGVEYLACVLADRYRIEKGDRICFLLPNSPALVAAYFACSKIGAIPVLLNPALPPERVNAVLEQTHAKVLFMEYNSAHKSGITYDVRSVYALDVFFPGPWQKAGRMVHQARIDPHDTVSILYSSGTTGEQKGVELTASNIFHNTYWASVFTGLTPSDRPICFLPQSHCFGIHYITIAALRSGATLVLHEKFDLGQVLNSLVENRVTVFYAVPAIFHLFLKQNVSRECFAFVRHFFYAADSLPVESNIAWERAYGSHILTGWGLTETSPFATWNHPERYKLGSVGTPIPGVEIKIVDADGCELPRMPDKENENYREFCGEICVRGHNVMKGYLGNPEETARAIKDGWFYTGDVGYLDEDGYLFIVDRLKDMINVGGEKAWPRQIEGIIAQHPLVKDAGVIGIPHEGMGEVPKAFIVLIDPTVCDTDGGAEEIKQKILGFISSLLMGHELPRAENIEFVDAMPRNPSGKILRRVLR